MVVLLALTLQPATPVVFLIQRNLGFALGHVRGLINGRPLKMHANWLIAEKRSSITPLITPAWAVM